MIDKDILLCFLFCPALFTIVYLRGAVYHIFTLGKSKTRIKKERKSIPFLKKLLLTGYAAAAKHYASTARRLCHTYWAYLAVTLVSILFWILSMGIPAVDAVFSKCVLIKLFVLDIPVNVYSFIMTKHDRKNGGATWVWTDKD